MIRDAHRTKPSELDMVWAGEHEALTEAYDELAYRANGIEITRHEWPRFEEVESNE